METLIQYQGGGIHQIVVIIHVLLFVYWLGGDLGVFYSSKFVVRPDISPEARAIAAKIMLTFNAIDNPKTNSTIPIRNTKTRSF